MPIYLFVLCPPYCGSTLLWKLLATSRHVSALPSEGQFLPELKDVMRDAPWQRERQLPWPLIKSVWESHWDMSRAVLVEKSPPNLIRTPDIVAHFQPVKFVVMVRNPYAHAEGLMRRNGWTVSRAANFAMMCLRAQLDNARMLDDALIITYENLVAEPAAAAAKLSEFLPELGTLDHGANFEVHSVDGTLTRPITDLNAKKIAALPASTLRGLNEVFSAQCDTLAAWEYELIPPHP